MARTYLPRGVKVKRKRYPKGHPKGGQYIPGAKKLYIGDGSHAPNLTGGLRIGPSRKQQLRRTRSRGSR